jgi:predicted ATPase
MNINELIEQRTILKKELDLANAHIANLKQTKEELDYQLLIKLDEQGLSRTANDKASVSINQDTVANVTDWDAFYSHVMQTEDFSLLQKRVSSVAYKELLKLGEEIPGVQPREIRRINFRSL